MSDEAHKKDMADFLKGLGAREVIWTGELPPPNRDAIAIKARDLVTAHPAFRQLEAELAEAKAVLREVEWGSCDGCGNKHNCPLCLRPKGGIWSEELGDLDPNTEHAPDCRLAKLLR